MDSMQLIGVGAVFLAAGGVKGVTGMGLPTVAMSLLGLWMAPGQAAALLVLPSLATNVAQCRGPHTRRLVALLWPMWLALAAATVAMPAVTGAAAGRHAHGLLGVVLTLYGLWGLWRPAMSGTPSRATWISACVGAATGGVAAATAVFVFPLVPYLQMLRLDKEAMVQALGLSFTLATLALAARLQATGGLVWLSADTAIALAMAFAGLRLGAVLRGRLAGPAFQRWLCVVLIALGVANLLQAV